MRKFLVPAIMIALVLPVSLAKPLIILLLAVLVLQHKNQLLERKWVFVKLGLLVLLSPGLMLTIYNSPHEVIRFVPLALLIVLFPYKKISLNIPSVCYTSQCIIIYLITSQILIAIGNEYFLTLRDVWYPYEGDVNPFEIDDIQNQFFYYGAYRAGGIFHNPNVMGSNIFLYFLMFASSRGAIQKSKLSVSLYSILLVAVGASLFVTGSRTYTFVFIMYLILGTYPVFYGFLTLGKVSVKYLIVGMLIVLGSVYLLAAILERLFQGFTAEGSAGIKGAILSNYIDSAFANGDYVSLLFGGVHSVMFDVDWGYLIGALGFVGLFSVFIYYFLAIRVIPAARAAILSFLLIGIGNSLVYGLASAVQVLIVIIIFAHVHFSTRHPVHVRRKDDDQSCEA